MLLLCCCAEPYASTRGKKDCNKKLTNLFNQEMTKLYSAAGRHYGPRLVTMIGAKVNDPNFTDFHDIPSNPRRVQLSS